MREKSNGSVGLEIASRFVKITSFVITTISWLLLVIGAWTLYLLWVEPTSSAKAGDRLLSCLAVILAIAALALLQGLIRWVLLVPLEAKIRGIDLRDPAVARGVRDKNIREVVLAIFTLLGFASVPLLIAHFRHDYFG